MRFAWLAALAVVLLTGCGVETIQIERQPAKAFLDDPAEASAYDSAERRCTNAKSLRELAKDVGAAKDTPDAIARDLGSKDDDPEVASATYSGCLDGIEAAKLD
jgi:predicted outer membrane protein